MKMTENSPNGRKTLWEKEKLLVTSNFSFSLSVFKRLVSERHVKIRACLGKGSTSDEQSTVLYRPGGQKGD